MSLETLEKPSTELTVQDSAALALASAKTRQDLIAMSTKYLAITEIKNKAGRDECHSAAMSLASARIAISKTGKAARDDANKFAKAIILEESSLIAITEPEEKRLLALRDGWDEVIAAEKAAREAAERDRINAIHAKIADIQGYHARAAMCRTAGQVDALLGELSRTSLGGFEEFADEAGAVHLDAMKRVEALLAEKHLQEEAATKLQAEQAAAAVQLAKERAELAEAREALARQVAEAKAQADAIAAKHLAEAVAVMAIDQPAPVIAPVAMRRPPPARTAPPVIAAPVARVYTDDVPTSADIFAMCMESQTADNFVKWLCTMAGVAFPPVNQGVPA